jgi:phage tail sheath gpL-like
MTIGFDQIPQHLRVPGIYTEIDPSKAASGAQLLALRLLLIGQTLPTGNAAASVPVRVTSADGARVQFGEGSMLGIMAAAAFAGSQANEVWALPLLDAPGALAATGEIGVAGMPTAAGRVMLYLAGQAVPVAVDAGDTPDAIVAATVAAINAQPMLPVSSSVEVDPDRARLTARHAGETGNDLDVRLNYFGEASVPGLTVTLTPFAGGSGNPDIAPALATLGDEWFQVWAMPYTDAANLTVLETELTSRFEAMREIEGQAYAVARGTLGTLAALGNARNSAHVSIVADDGGPMPTYAKAAETAALVARYASDDPARPLQTLPYRYCLPAAEGERFTATERNVLLFDGIATTTVDDGGVMRTERLITTYRTNASGAADTAYLDSEPMFTLMAIRHDWKNTLARKYPRHKVADDGTRFAPGQVVVTPNTIKAEAVAKFREWESLGQVEDFAQFQAELVVQRNASDPGRIDVLFPPNLINGLRVIATKIQFRL